jgi:hypothetical protein
MSPPHTIKEAILDPIHTAIYIAFVLSTCATFKTSIEVKKLVEELIAWHTSHTPLACFGFVSRELKN